MLHDIDPGLLADGQRDGLTTAEAADRRERHGANDILPPMPSGVWRLLAASLSDPMLWFLVVSAGLFALVGERSEAVVLLVAIAPLFGMDAFLHGRTQTSTAALATRSKGDRTQRPSITIPYRLTRPRTTSTFGGVRYKAR